VAEESVITIYFAEEGLAIVIYMAEEGFEYMLRKREQGWSSIWGKSNLAVIDINMAEREQR
jgi:hypothetical protein